MTLSLPVFALTIWMTLLYKAYKGRKPYKKRDHPELGDACLSQVQFRKFKYSYLISSCQLLIYKAQIRRNAALGP